MKVPQLVGDHGSTKSNLFGVNIEPRKGMFCGIIYLLIYFCGGWVAKIKHQCHGRSRDHQTERIQSMMGECVVSCHRVDCHLASTLCNSSRIGYKFRACQFCEELRVCSYLILWFANTLACNYNNDDSLSVC